MKKYIKCIIGMLIVLSILLIIIVLNLIGCFNNKMKITNNDNKNQEELKCFFNEKLEINCNDTILQEYNENNDLILFKEKNGELMKYEYTYNDKNYPKRVRINSTDINIFYDNNNMISSVSYNNNDDSIFNYNFSYNKNKKLKEINKTYNGKNLGNIIYEYYLENNINYIKETDNTQEYQRIRIYKSEDILSNNTFHIINYIPYPLIKKKEYLLFSDFTQVNTGFPIGHYTPIFVSKIEKDISIYNGIEKVTTYHYDEKGRLIYIDNIDSYNYYKDSPNKTIRTTIFEEYDPYIDIVPTYYKYEIVYEYDNNKITKFTKYKNTKVSGQEFMKLKDKCLKYTYNKKKI